MSDHPILFSGPMIRAILDGSKTQTRRVVNMGFLAHSGQEFVRLDRDIAIFKGLNSGDEYKRRCSCGVPGDRLYVKETWQVVDHDFGAPATSWLRQTPFRSAMGMAVRRCVAATVRASFRS